ncbi:olfactomedin-like protein 2B isoform X2 [Pipistrellus kuhlii]|uniref:olfactomedin-like protein 2B isoform X2 n=1 Tax=Pipistrellus kuhlii TaxID=59472 RepID=UPI001E26FD38|nr:olfactomedin-like protein 2B isoform X2 [Pipistrellus kuhlii]
MAQPLLLALWLALGVALSVAAVTPAGTSEPPTAPTVAPTEAETLQSEADNQENVLSQLLGDYDKVKAVSEGSDCQCKCVVRPMGHDACKRVNAGASRKEDFYTVETITSGPSCKCACVAPPSALNPCEGDFRLQKLREADSRDLKLATIIDMLEGAFYGLDLLKLHSVTTKLVGRVDKLEEEVSKNLTKENEQTRADAGGVRAEAKERGGGENCSQAAAGLPGAGAGPALQRDEAAYAHPEQYEEEFLREETVSQHVNAIELLRTQPLAPPELVRPRQPVQRQVSLRGRPASKPAVIRGITFYKAQDPEDENGIEEQQDPFSGGDSGVDLLIEDQLLRHNSLLPTEPRRPAAAHHGTAAPAGVSAPRPQASPSAPRVPAASAEPVPTPQPATVPPAPGGAPPPTVAPTATPSPPAPASLPAAPGDTRPSTVPPTAAGTGSPGKAAPAAGTAGPSALPEDDIRNVIGRCKDTLSTITGPTTQNTFGRSEGAWMKDPLASDERIYVTDSAYGSTLVEFRNLDNFRQGRWSNSYKLPYSWAGTGHAVYGGAFFYSRAFARTLIKYDLRRRFVAAWALLHDVAYEEAAPRSWQGRSDVDFAVDENGLWLIYPALDEEGLGQEVIVLSKLNAADLSTRKETTWRTGLRRSLYGHCFVICGVLYAVDSHRQRNASISYAFDTHTNTQIVPRLLFENEYSHTTQVDYNPKDRLLYAWDNGHQVTYHVIFAY